MKYFFLLICIAVEAHAFEDEQAILRALSEKAAPAKVVEMIQSRQLHSELAITKAIQGASKELTIADLPGINSINLIFHTVANSLDSYFFAVQLEQDRPAPLPLIVYQDEQPLLNLDANSLHVTAVGKKYFLHTDIIRAQPKYFSRFSLRTQAGRVVGGFYSPWQLSISEYKRLFSIRANVRKTGDKISVEIPSYRSAYYQAGEEQIFNLAIMQAGGARPIWSIDPQRIHSANVIVQIPADIVDKNRSGKQLELRYSFMEIKSHGRLQVIREYVKSEPLSGNR
jgi:hypothetical protein